MADDFQVGDVVVCVNADMIDCPHDPEVLHAGFEAPARGAIGRVRAIAPAPAPEGERWCGCTAIFTDDGAGIIARFRKLPKADDRFAEQMRALKPHRVREPA